MSRQQLRLAAPIVSVPLATRRFDYRILSDLHYALRAADEAVQMARATPRYAELVDLVDGRDAAVEAAIANLQKVLNDE
jgi:hypothetical protein